MSDIYKAKPNDIFVDKDGKLWRVIWTCSEPTIGMRELEPMDVPPRKMEGGIGGLMWDGFKLIHRQDEEVKS